MTAHVVRAFLKRYVEVLGMADGEGRPTLLGEGWVLGTQGGAVLLGKGPEEPADQAVDIACIVTVVVRTPAPALASVHGAKVMGLRPGDAA